MDHTEHIPYDSKGIPTYQDHNLVDTAQLEEKSECFFNDSPSFLDRLKGFNYYLGNKIMEGLTGVPGKVKRLEDYIQLAVQKRKEGLIEKKSRRWGHPTGW